MSGPVTWDTLDWEALARLRETFLAGESGAPPNRRSPADLAQYDFTFGRRIAWKWAAALDELRERGWRPPAGPLLDWGCGSGAAGRAVAAFFGPERFGVMRVADRSRLAAEHAAAEAQRAWPGLKVETAGPDDAAAFDGAVLIVSHVLSELAEEARRALVSHARRAAAVLWVEPGTHATSRALIAVRESLRGSLRLVAPCTHQAPCGMLAAENARHWCHHFAAVPAGIMNHSGWVLFGRRAGIDLRSLPYSFIAMERPRSDAPPDEPEAWRLIGAPRVYTGFARVLACGGTGVGEYRLLKRDDPALYKAMRKGIPGRVHRWTRDGDRMRPCDGRPGADGNEEEERHEPMG